MEMKKRLFSIALVVIAYVDGAKFTIKNNCKHTVWPATLTGAGIDGSRVPTGFRLEPGQSTAIEVPPNWSGRMWGRYECSGDASGGFTCLSGDCASAKVACSGKGGIPPATLAEFTLAGGGGNDFYDVSLVDGFNLPISISKNGCPSTSCPVNVNFLCPQGLSVRDPRGVPIACKSGCLAFGKPELCCAPPYNTPETCPPSVYSRRFKRLCPQAYSYAYDDKTSTFTCPTSTPGDYFVTFCP